MWQTSSGVECSRVLMSGASRFVAPGWTFVDF